MTNNLFSQVVPLLVAMALPVPMIKAIRYLLAGRPVAHSLLMIATWGAALFLALCIAVMLKSALNNVLEFQIAYLPSKAFSGWLHLVAGLLLISIGVKKLQNGLQNRSLPATRQVSAITASSIIKTTIHTALFSVKNSLLMILIIYLFLNNDITPEHSLVVSGMIALTSMIWVSIPLLMYVSVRHQRERILELLKQWLTLNQGTLVIFIYLFIGISTLSTGIGQLIPDILDRIFQAIA